MATEWKRRNLPHLTRPGATYFVTFCRHARFERSLTGTQVAPIIVQTLQGRAEARYVLYDYTVMPDHVHVILKPVQRPGTERMPEPEHWALSEIMQGIKGNSARDINEALGREGSVWQAESHDHIVRGRRGYKAAARYVGPGVATQETDGRRRGGGFRARRNGIPPVMGFGGRDGNPRSLAD